jgi:phosphate transport system substrate-binding protein
VRGQQRLAEVKNGKGTEIVVCNLTGCEDVLKDLSLEFVKAKTTVQLKFQKGEARDTAIEKLAKGAADLLLADGPIPARGQGSASSKSPNPKSVELGRMAVGIIVHPENPLESLPLDEAKAIFCGEVKKWPAVRGAAAAMHVFGLRNTNPTTQLLKEKLVEVGSGRWSVGSGQSRASTSASRSLKYSALPDNEKVVLAVARDPAAIGFVDISQLPPNDKSVKAVPVLLPGQSPVKQAATKDTKKAKNKARGGKKDASEDVLANGKPEIPNPLSRTLTLYVSPNASRTAKDFADFLTPEHCKEVIAQYNLLPPLHVPDAGQLAKGSHPHPSPGLLKTFRCGQ